MKKVVAIVVTYNRLEMLKKCISALQNQTYKCDVMVINNASTDGTDAWLENICYSHSNVKRYNTGSNIGGAGGFNYGMKKAMNGDYDYLWLMDDDCVVNEDALEKLLNADNILGSDNYGYLSSVVLWKDGTECKMNRQKIKKTYFKYSHFLMNNIIEVEQSTFVSLFIPKNTVKRVGFPIKEFFIWGDDIEYTRRITIRNSIPSFMVENSIVTHFMHDNNGSSIATDDIKRIDRYKYAFRNEFYLYRKEGIKGTMYYFAKCILNIFRILTKSKDHIFYRIVQLMKGILDGLLFNPLIEK